MRKKAVFYLIFILLIACVIYYLTQTESLGKTAQATKKEMNAAFSVKLKSIELTLNLAANLILSDTVDLSFKVAGKLEEGEIDFQREKQFKKNQLLYQINNRNAFLQYLDEKKQFQNQCDEAIKILEKLILPNELVKWKVFASSLSENQLIADFPAVSNAEEQKIVTNLNLLKNYKEIKKTESNMSNYFYLAPFDGKIISINAKVGKNIRKHQVVAKLVATGAKTLKVEMDSSDFSNVKSVEKIWAQVGNFKYELDWKAKTVVEGGSKVTLLFKVRKWKHFDSDHTISVKLIGKSLKKYAAIPSDFIHNGSVKTASRGSVVKVKVQQTFKDSALVLGLDEVAKIIK